MIVMIREKIRGISTAVFIVFICASMIHSQSLVEVAKKEKERRAALKAKGKKSILVTNTDLKEQRRLPMNADQPQAPSPRRGTQDRQRTAPRSSSQSTTLRKSSEQSQSRDVYGYRKNATKVIFTTEPVNNPELALRKPDQQFATLSEMGVMDLEFSAKNGPGADIAIYARMSTQQQTASKESEEGGQPLRPTGVDPLEGFWYGVLVRDGDDDWLEIGKGNGMSSPEQFDLGNISEIKRIRIMFKSHNNPTIAAKLNRMTVEENTLGIDAVEALH
ncbi:MAG: hypothetical protein PVH84_03590 [Candidatus Aminicenantes bacterium]|jgi:hypothetical protein